MAEKIQAIRGMKDILPNETPSWRYLELAFMQCMQRYGYEEIRFPLLESTQLFKRTIGDVTDIVEKEMYTFFDLNGDSLTLRPEGTAGCVRACLQNGLLHQQQQQKLWYTGPMFRHEKPQKGRYRQFSHFGVEVFGIDGAGIELELISISQRLWAMLGLTNALTLEINSIGDMHDRRAYKEALLDYLKPHVDTLDEDSQRRLTRNPLRILDSKDPNTQALVAEAPTLQDTMSEGSKQRFNDYCDGLKALGIPFTINPRLVRGLDYYGHLVFEWTTTQLGSQATVCAGGRFDGLVEQLGGKPTPAVGFALGVERLLLLAEQVNGQLQSDTVPAIYMMAVGDQALLRAMSLAETLRNAPHDFNVVLNTSGGSLKSQFKKADKSRAKLALIIGEEELLAETVSVKPLRQQSEQKTIPHADIVHFVSEYLTSRSTQSTSNDRVSLGVRDQ